MNINRIAIATVRYASVAFAAGIVIPTARSADNAAPSSAAVEQGPTKGRPSADQAEEREPIAPPTAQNAGKKERSRRLPPIGINLSSYTPTSSKTRDAFGTGWIDVGPDIGSGAPDRTRQLDPSVSSLKRNHNGNKLLILQAGAKYLVALDGHDAQPQARRGGLLPYAGLKGYVTYARVQTPAYTGKSTHWVLSGAAVLGVGIGKSYFIETRYRYFPKINGYDFSGSELEAGVRF